MFGKNRYDDDYEEYVKERNRETSSKKESKKPLPAYYYTRRDMSCPDKLIFKAKKWNSGIKATMASMSFILIIVMTSLLAVAANDGSLDSDTIVPLVIFFGFCFVFIVVLPLLMAGGRIKALEVTSNSIIVTKRSKSIITIPYEKYKGISVTRHKSKNGGYTGSSYTLTYEADGKPKKLYIFDVTPIQASEIKYEIEEARSKHLDPINSDSFSAESFSERTFTWHNNPKKVKTNNTLITAFLILPMIMISFIFVIHNVIASGELSRVSMLPIFPIVFLVIIMAVFSFIVSKKSGYASVSSLSCLTLNSMGLSADGTFFRTSEIVNVELSHPGHNDPRGSYNSVLLINTETMSHKFEVYIPSSKRLMQVGQITENPDWRYEDFYQTFKSWGKASNIKVMDYIV